MGDSISKPGNPWDWIERILKISGILALFGYMSLRAHFSFLGISSVSTLGTEQYFMETYRFAAYLISILAPMVALLIFILSMLPDSIRGRGLGMLNRRWLRQLAVPVIAVVLLVFGLRMLQLLSQYGTDIAVGTLKHQDVDRSAGQYFCAFSVMGSAGAFVVVRYFLRNCDPEDVRSRWAWRAIAVLLILVTLQIPILYGYYVHTTEFPLVLATSGDDKQQSNACGLLLFDTGADILMWSEHNAKGQVQQIPRARLRSLMILGQGELLSAVRTSLSQHNGNIPDCQP
jgi:hypothetical protein